MEKLKEFYILNEGIVNGVAFVALGVGIGLGITRFQKNKKKSFK